MSNCCVLQTVIYLGITIENNWLRSREVKPVDKNHRSERIIPRAEQAGAWSIDKLISCTEQLCTIARSTVFEAMARNEVILTLK